jgi:hypothetical protein
VKAQWILCIVLVVMSASLNYGQAQKNLEKKQTLDMTLAGKINDDPFKFECKFVANPNTGEWEMDVTYSNIPKNYHPLAVSGNSIASTSCCGFGRGADGAMNLLQLASGTEKAPRVGKELGFDAEQRVCIMDGGKVVGEVDERVTLYQTAPDKFKAEGVVSGWYKGPLDLASTPGYRLMLRQVGPGKIEAIYSNKVFRTDGKSFITSSASRIYTYGGDRLLPQSQIAAYEVHKSDVDGVKVKQSGRTIHLPADQWMLPKGFELKK